MTDDELAAVVAAAAIVAARNAPAPDPVPASRWRRMNRVDVTDPPKRASWKMSGRLLG